jgi:hypothetical protein
MVNRRISEDIEQCALRLWTHGWDVQDICEALPHMNPYPEERSVLVADNCSYTSQ